MSEVKNSFRYLVKDDASRQSNDAWVIDRGIVQEFLHTLREKEYRPGTLVSYEMYLCRLMERFPEREPLKRGSLDIWYGELVDSGLAAVSAQAHIVAANSLLEYCGLRELQSFRQTEKRKHEQPELSREEYIRLLQAAKALGKERDYLLVKLFALSGIERTALQNICVEALEENRISFKARGVEKTARLSDSLRCELLDYANRNGILTGPVFLSEDRTPLNDLAATKSIRRLASAAKVPIEKANPRCLQRLYQTTRAQLEKDSARLVAQEIERRIQAEEE